MGRVGFAAVLVLVGTVGLGRHAHACGAARATAHIDTFSCACDGGLGTQVYEITGTATVLNRQATPLLGSLVVEIQALQHLHYVPIARQVLNAFGASAVETCAGPLEAGPVDGGIVLVDKDGKTLAFDDVKHLMHGQTALMFVATFAGTLPQVTPGDKVRIKLYTTAVDADGALACQVDGDGDGTVDAHVNTLTFQKIVRVPTTSFLLAP